MVKALDNPTPLRRETASNGAKKEVATSERPLSTAPETPEAALREVRTLVEAGNLRLARERAAAFLEIWPENERLQAADRVLGPPKKLPQRTDLPYIPRDSGGQVGAGRSRRERADEFSALGTLGPLVTQDFTDAQEAQ